MKKRTYSSAETALQLTQAKIAAGIKKSYFKLQRSRQLSRAAQKMGSSAFMLMKVSSASENPMAKAARRCRTRGAGGRFGTPGLQQTEGAGGAKQ